MCKHTLQGLISLRALDFEQTAHLGQASCHFRNQQPGYGVEMKLHNLWLLHGTPFGWGQCPPPLPPGPFWKVFVGSSRLPVIHAVNWSFQKDFHICGPKWFVFLISLQDSWAVWEMEREMHVLGPPAFFLPALASYLTVLALSVSLSRSLHHCPQQNCTFLTTLLFLLP